MEITITLSWEQLTQLEGYLSIAMVDVVSDEEATELRDLRKYLLDVARQNAVDYGIRQASMR